MPEANPYQCIIDLPGCPANEPLYHAEEYAVHVTLLRDPKVPFGWPLLRTQVEALLRLSAPGTQFNPAEQAVIFSKDGMETAITTLRITDTRIKQLRIHIALLLTKEGTTLLTASHTGTPVRNARVLTQEHTNRSLHQTATASQD
jgi:hypothetical protein